jgi:hypothetical protein
MVATKKGVATLQVSLLAPPSYDARVTGPIDPPLESLGEGLPPGTKGWSLVSAQPSQGNPFQGALFQSIPVALMATLTNHRCISLTGLHLSVMSSMGGRPLAPIDFKLPAALDGLKRAHVPFNITRVWEGLLEVTCTVSFVIDQAENKLAGKRIWKVLPSVEVATIVSSWIRKVHLRVANKCPFALSSLKVTHGRHSSAPQAVGEGEVIQTFLGVEGGGPPWR